MARDYSDVTPDTLSTAAASDELRQVLPTARASVGVEQVEEDPGGKQITVRIRWRNFAGLEEHVQLTAWKYALIPEAAAP